MVLVTRVPIFAWLGLFRSDLAHPGAEMARQVLIGISLSLFTVGAVLGFSQLAGELAGVVLVEATLSAAILIGAREFMTATLVRRLRRSRRREPVVIYGAGEAGMQLAGSLAGDGSYEFRVVCFLDDDKLKQGTRIKGLEVYSPDDLPDIVPRFGVERALLAIPSLPGWKRQPLLQHLHASGLAVSTVPRLIDLVSGRVSLQELAEITADDLLGREEVSPDEKLLRADVTGKVVAVTGAGGSIGSELCCQIAALKPKALVLIENSEFALYRIRQELWERFPQAQVTSFLGSVLNQHRLHTLFASHAVETLYHAAAYKHVPLVEENPVAGIWNNVIGTWRTAEMARSTGVKTMLLVSTDKAVRPTSVMGASKRAAELACLMVGHVAAKEASWRGEFAPRYVMVRFGNVLDSAGSVVPLFRRQISAGGPITVTHPDVTRYFMTIPEAAQLVLQAGALGRGGEVFLLEMGEPVRIADLAQRMIDLTPDVSSSEIEIRFTGLRPGEKLFEEILADPSQCGPTDHPKIFQAREGDLAWEKIRRLLDELEASLALEDPLASLHILGMLVPDFVPSPAFFPAPAERTEARRTPSPSVVAEMNLGPVHRPDPAPKPVPLLAPATGRLGEQGALEPPMVPG